MKKLLIVFASLLTISITAREFKDVVSAQAAQVNRVGNSDLMIELPRFVFSHTNTKIAIKFKDPAHDKLVANGRKLHFIVNGDDQVVEFDASGAGSLTCTFTSSNQLTVLFEDANLSREVPVISIWYMVLPLVALFLFLGYKLTFPSRKLTVISKGEATEQKDLQSSLKLVKEEEEVLV